MLKDYINYKKAKELMKKINKMSWWDAEIVEDKYNKEIRIENTCNPDIDEISKVTQLLMDNLKKFSIHFDKEELHIRIKVRY